MISEGSSSKGVTLKTQDDVMYNGKICTESFHGIFVEAGLSLLKKAPSQKGEWSRLVTHRPN